MQFLKSFTLLLLNAEYYASSNATQACILIHEYDSIFKNGTDLEKNIFFCRQTNNLQQKFRKASSNLDGIYKSKCS